MAFHKVRTNMMVLAHKLGWFRSLQFSKWLNFTALFPCHSESSLGRGGESSGHSGTPQKLCVCAHSSSMAMHAKQAKVARTPATY